jgi:hypothetical protein
MHIAYLFLVVQQFKMHCRRYKAAGVQMSVSCSYQVSFSNTTFKFLGTDVRNWFTVIQNISKL